ncbi:hypothetical protein Scep_019659 [Stephania cephalantha]|uniref:Secreted protein n=1 Tax=Stephania cephalantha TaxID=152367 RepID=A0AAP0IBL1_9MAGN
MTRPPPLLAVAFLHLVQPSAVLPAVLPRRQDFLKTPTNSAADPCSDHAGNSAGLLASWRACWLSTSRRRLWRVAVEVVDDRIRAGSHRRRPSASSRRRAGLLRDKLWAPLRAPFETSMQTHHLSPPINICQGNILAILEYK